MQDFVRQWWRLGGICGILFLVTFIIGGAVQGESPTYSDPVEEIREFWVNDGEDYLIGDYIIGLGFMLFFFPFLSALRGLLGLAEGGGQMWSRVVFAGGLLFLALAAADGIFWTTLAFGDVAENASDDTINLVMALDVGAAHFIPVGAAVMTLATAIVIFQTRALPLWLAGLSLLEGVLAIIGPLSILADDPDDSVLGFLPFVGAAIWMLATSIVLVMKKDAPSAAGVTASSAGGT
jgi:hypothetical protein